MTAVPAPTDTPADADALRDDIAANLVPAINDNLADLGAIDGRRRSRPAPWRDRSAPAPSPPIV
ncbi:MAG TPA: hypothetical protein VMP03_14330 [Methylomirabilota bacterium]|nr:hypothetical protein [Methylomirabilota bacterium]